MQPDGPLTPAAPSPRGKTLTPHAPEKRSGLPQTSVRKPPSACPPPWTGIGPLSAALGTGTRAGGRKRG